MYLTPNEIEELLDACLTGLSGLDVNELNEVNEELYNTFMPNNDDFDNTIKKQKVNINIYY